MYTYLSASAMTEESKSASSLRPMKTPPAPASIRACTSLGLVEVSPGPALNPGISIWANRWRSGHEAGSEPSEVAADVGGTVEVAAAPVPAPAK